MALFNTLFQRLNEKQKKLKLKDSDENIIAIQNALYELHIQEMKVTQANMGSHLNEIMFADDENNSINESASNILKAIVNLKKIK